MERGMELHLTEGRLQGSLHLPLADGRQPPLPLYTLSTHFPLTLSHLCLHPGEHYPADTGFKGTNFMTQMNIKLHNTLVYVENEHLLKRILSGNNLVVIQMVTLGLNNEGFSMSEQ